jgi:cold shock CspA family protein
MNEKPPTQQTRPKKGEPIEIPVPKHGDVMDFLEKTATRPDPDRYPSVGKHTGTLRGTVGEWSEDDGWGVLVSPDLPGKVFAHWMHIRGQGSFGTLTTGDAVEFEANDHGQDGCEYKALWVERLPDA